MNRCVWIVFASFALPLFALKKDPAYREARRNGADAKIVVRVVDEEGVAIAGSSIVASIDKGLLDCTVTGTTDSQGEWVLEEHTTGGYFMFFVNKDGYYETKSDKISYTMMGAEHEVKDGKWQPYGAVETLTLRKIKKPVRMLTSYYGRCDFKIMVTNAVFGFDMEVGDFVEPYGSGKTPDICMEFSSDGLQPSVSMHSSLTLSFPDPLGGAYAVPTCKQSNFKGPYAADVSRFSSDPIVLENRRIDGRNELDKIGPESILVIRSRCKVDEAGKIVSAHYGTIEWLSFSVSYWEPGCLRICYQLNPMSNDTNLEPLYERPSLRRKNQKLLEIKD